MSGWNDVPDGDDSGFDPLPKDWYACQCVLAEAGRSKNKGTPQVRVRWEVTHGEYANRLIFDDVYLTDGTKPQVKKLLVAVGADLDSAASAEEMIADPGLLAASLFAKDATNASVGLKAFVKVAHDWKGPDGVRRDEPRVIVGMYGYRHIGDVRLADLLTAKASDGVPW